MKRQKSAPGGGGHRHVAGPVSVRCLRICLRLPWSFDRFHVIKLYNDGLSDLRRKLYHEATDLMQKQVIKGTRWLLLKNPENLSQDRQEAERLEEALRLNQPLALAYYLKEDLRQFWEQPSKTTAVDFLEDWIARAQTAWLSPSSCVSPRPWLFHPRGLLAYYDYPIYRPLGRDQQQNQDHAAPSLWLPGSGIFQT